MTVRKLLEFMPSFVRNLIDPYSLKIDSFVEKASREIESGGHVLDAGAGECTYKAFFRHQWYTAVDFCVGDRKWDYSGIDVTCDLEALPFKSDTFDAAICTQVLEHVKEPGAVLKEIQRVLKPGKRLYFSAPQGWGVHQAPHDYFRFTRYGLAYLMEKAGFEVISIQPAGGYYHYLANRLTVLPKTLFWQIKPKMLHALLLPLEIVFYSLFVLLIPMVLNAIDFLDRKRDFTLNYLVKAKKPARISCVEGKLA